MANKSPKRLAEQEQTQISSFIPASGALPTPDVLAAYAAIDPEYPAFLRSIFDLELRRNFTYQIVVVIASCVFGCVLVGGACYMGTTGHPGLAATLVGANCIGVLTKLLTRAATRRG